MKKIVTSGKGRVCRYKHCINILSIYNHELYCYAHLDKMMQEPAIKGLKSKALR